MSELSDRGKRFHTAIAGFIDARREAKFKGKEDTGDVAAKYDYATWIADAARRVAQIKAVTHVLKATHPDARGSNLHLVPSSMLQRNEVGTHVLGANYAEDVVGNAAALDVFKLLKLDVEGKRLLDWMQTEDVDLQAALSDDAGQARGWMQAFSSLVREDAKPASHPMAKQLYWLTGELPQDDGHYHLLQPLFSSSLAHAVHADVQGARFGDVNKTLRQARRDNKPSEGVYRDYRNLVVRKLGGTKPQNISQLNSERGGVNYLLASLPPAAWKPREGTSLLKLDSVFNAQRSAFYYFGDVRLHVRALADFLKSDPEQKKETRDRRKAMEQAIGEELAMFGAAVRSRHAVGWTREPGCELALCEQLWLDPERSEMPPRDDPEQPYLREADSEFSLAYAHGNWADEVATNFGLWLNGQLRKRGGKLLALGETEMHHFARQAILDVAWPIPLQRRATGGQA